MEITATAVTMEITDILEILVITAIAVTVEITALEIMEIMVMEILEITVITVKAMGVADATLILFGAKFAKWRVTLLTAAEIGTTVMTKRQILLNFK